MGEIWGEVVGLSLRDSSWPRTRASQLYGVMAGVLLMCALGASIGYLVARPDTRGGAGPTAGAARDEPISPPRAERAPESTPAQPDTPLVTEGVTVQVLDATGRGRAGARMARHLSLLGFDVVVVNNASVVYDRTTVMWSRPADKKAAVALATRFGWRVEHKPRNLSASVTTHVVVGRDEA
jgi:hypothetical protein